MAIRMNPSKKAKYFVLNQHIKDTGLNPKICSFFGNGYFSTSKKEAFELKKDLEEIHKHTHIYTVHIWNPIS